MVLKQVKCPAGFKIICEMVMLHKQLIASIWRENMLGYLSANSFPRAKLEENCEL